MRHLLTFVTEKHCGKRCRTREGEGARRGGRGSAGGSDPQRVVRATGPGGGAGTQAGPPERTPAHPMSAPAGATAAGRWGAPAERFSSVRRCRGPGRGPTPAAGLCRASAPPPTRGRRCRWSRRARGASADSRRTGGRRGTASARARRTGAAAPPTAAGARGRGRGGAGRARRGGGSPAGRRTRCARGWWRGRGGRGGRGRGGPSGTPRSGRRPSAWPTPTGDGWGRGGGGTQRHVHDPSGPGTVRGSVGAGGQSSC